MKELEDVKKAAAQAAAWRERLEMRMRVAYVAGASLRAIAEAAGVSHEHVRRMLRSED